MLSIANQGSQSCHFLISTKYLYTTSDSLSILTLRLTAILLGANRAASSVATTIIDIKYRTPFKTFMLRIY